MKRILLTGKLILITTLIFAQNIDPEVYKELEYRNVGPTRGGRVTTVTGIENEPGTFFMGSTGGGVWKTTNYGTSWKPVSDGFFETGSIGSIAVSSSNNMVVYAGTGSDGIRSNVITGKGIYRSNDKGKTWSHIGLTNVGQIGAVIIHPENEDVVYVAAIGNPFRPGSERGVYHTSDGGKSWNKILFVSDSTGFVDLEFAPDDPETIYASAWKVERKPWTIISGGNEGGIYKSTDGGKKWNKLNNGLPTGLIGKSDLAVSISKPERVWALIEAPQGEGGVFLSDDKGESFKLVSTKKELLDRPFYYCNIDVNPLNPDDIFVNSTRFWRSKDGGENWKSLRTPHGDNHDIWINPVDTLLWIQANDGGANVTRDGGKTWSSIENQSTAELYQVDIDDQFPYWLYAGQQDNSTIAVPSSPPYSSPAGNNAYWRSVGGCETGPAVPKPGNSNIVYSNCKGRFMVHNKLTGQTQQYYVGAANMYGQNPKDLKYRFQRVSPIYVSPHNADVVYHTSQFVHKTMDDGKTWETVSPDLTAFTEETQVISGYPITRDVTGEEFYSTIYSIVESPLSEGEIWTGSNDGPVYLTQDGGKTWNNVTPGDLPSGGRVQTLDASNHKEGKAYFAAYRYLLGDYEPYIYKTEDFGKTWERITDGDNGIPGDVPTRVIREDPQVEGLLYAGTEIGMYVSWDDGKNWSVLQQNLPAVQITDIKVHDDDLVISTMGRGFWILDNISAIRKLKNKIGDNAIVFNSKDAYRRWYRGSAETIPTYPGPGVFIDYYLPEENSNISLDILNNDGEVVRSFDPESVENNDDKEVSMATGFFARGNNAKLKTGAGIHRVQWDLRHVGPYNKDEKRDGRNGPVVSPGVYTVRLNINGESIENNLKVDLDPRVEKAGVTMQDVENQELLSLKIRDFLSEIRKVENDLSERKEALSEKGSLSGKQKKELESIEKILDQLATAEGRYMEPGLVAQTNYLYNMLNSADQLPGKDAYERFDELKSWYDEYVKVDYIKVAKDNSVLD